MKRINLDNGIRLKIISDNSKEIAFKAQKKICSQEIYKQFSVPKVYVGKQ